MANPNLAALSAVYGTSQLAALTTAQVAVFNNAAGSGQLLKVDELVLANYSTAQVTALVKEYNQDDLGGTGFHIAANIPIPSGVSIAIIDRSTAKLLVEDRSIGASVSAASSVDATGSAEVLS